MEATFRATNRQAFPVLVKEVVPDCNCTKVTLSKELLAPGETGELHASTLLRGESGLVEKRISVYTDDTTAGPAILTLAMTVAERFTLQPRALRWPAGSSEEKVIVVPGGRDGAVVKLDFDRARFAVTKMKLGDRGELRVRPLTRQSARGNLVVTFLTSSKRVVRLEASLEILPANDAAPSRPAGGP